MTKRRFWPDGLAGRVTVILLATLMLEFVGSEFIFRRFEALRADRENIVRLSEHLAVAERVVLSLPPAEREAAAQRYWQAPITVHWHPRNPLAGQELSAVSGPSGIQLASRNGRTLEGGMPLADGSWLSFTAVDYLNPRRTLHSHAAALIILVACLALAAILVMRMLGRPLRKLAIAADTVGREDPVTVEEQGPREVRQVATAFNAMQTRLLDVVNDRMEALAAVSHDLRTPIARMRLRLANQRAGKTRLAMEHDLDEMEAFITSVVDYLRGEDFEAERLVDVASIVLTIVDDAQDMGGEAAYHGPTRLEIVTRPVKLQRAVLNIVQNAIKHAGSAKVTLHAEPTAIVITVEDEGPGIPLDQMEAVFTPFRRLEASRNRSTGGSGLGLSIVRRAMQRLGGEVELANREGGGLRATLRLPRPEARGA